MADSLEERLATGQSVIPQEPVKDRIVQATVKEIREACTGVDSEEAKVMLNGVKPYQEERIISIRKESIEKVIGKAWDKPKKKDPPPPTKK